MSARRAILPAALLAVVAVTPTFAQDPPAAAPAPQAVERVNRRARPDDTAERAPRGGERQRSPEVRQRERVAVAPAEPAAAAAPAPALEEQGGRRRPSGGSGGRGSGRVSGGSRGGGGGDAGARPRGGVRNPNVDGGRDAEAQAIPRSRAPRPSTGGWGSSYGRRYYGGPSGFGYYYYDPWSWYGWGPGYGASAWGWGGYYGGGYGNYGYGSYGSYGGPYGWSIGGVRLKVDERDAEVYVDGYYAGTVDDFDGIWQQLRLDDGGYRIEIKKPGFDTLVFDVRILPGRTITYRGQMARMP